MEKQEKMVMPCEVWSRIVGYYRPVQAWNVGKRQEFNDRVMYDRAVFGGQNGNREEKGHQ